MTYPSPRHDVSLGPILFEEPVPVTAPAVSLSPRHNEVLQEPVLSEESVHATAHVASLSPRRYVEYQVPDLIAPVVSDTSPSCDESRDPTPTWDDFFQYMENQEPGLVAEPDVSIIHVAFPKRASGSLTQSSMVVQGNHIRHSCNICPQIS